MTSRIIKIGCYDYEAEEVDPKYFSGAEGHVVVSKQFIAIDKSSCKHRKGEILMHEALHALIDVAGLDHDILDDSEDEEQLIRRLSPLLYAFIRDNISDDPFGFEKGSTEK